MKRLLILLLCCALLAGCQTTPAAESSASSSAPSLSIDSSAADDAVSHTDSTASSEIVPPSGVLSSRPETGYERYEQLVRETYADTLATFEDEIPIPWEDSFVVRTERVDAVQLTQGEKTECALFSIDGQYWVLGILTDTPSFHRIADADSESYLLAYHDLDGDGCDEILTHFPTPSLGYASHIYRWEAGELTPLMALSGNSFFLDDDPLGWVDPGFELTVRDGFRFEVSQPDTAFRQTYDVSGMDGELRKIFYQEDGSINDWHPLYYEYLQADVPYPNGEEERSYTIFQPVDREGDGIYELVVGRPFVLDIQLRITVGTEYLLLAYNPSSDTFEIQKADFDMLLGHPEGTLADDWYR